MQIRSKTLHLLARYSNESNPQAIDLDSELDELDLDSLAMFEVVYELEESFSVELDEKELIAVETVGDLVERIERKLSGQD